MANTTWNPLDAHSRFTLSGGNLIATAASLTGDHGVVTVDGQSSGNYYLEVTTGGTFGGSSCIGVNTLSPNWTQAITNDSSGAYLYFSSGTIFYNGSTSGFSVAAVTSGNVICIALDLTNNKVWFRKNGGNWNGNATHNPATNSGGISLATLVATDRRWFVLAGAGTSATPVFTLNAGDGTFTQAVPSGFTAGWPDSGAVSTGAAFDPLTATAGITLLNGGRTADAAVAGSTPQRVKAGSCGATGKYYWEYYINAAASSTTTVGGGISNANVLTDNFFNNATDGAALFGTNSINSMYVNGTGIFLGQASTFGGPGSVLCVAVDLSARLVWMRFGSNRWNNNVSADPATGALGASISALTGNLFPAVTGAGGAAWRISLNNTDKTKIPPPAGFIVGPPVVVAAMARLQYAVTVNSG